MREISFWRRCRWSQCAGGVDVKLQKREDLTFWVEIDAGSSNCLVDYLEYSSAADFGERLMFHVPLNVSIAALQISQSMASHLLAQETQRLNSEKNEIQGRLSGVDRFRVLNMHK